MDNFPSEEWNTNRPKKRLTRGQLESSGALPKIPPNPENALIAKENQMVKSVVKKNETDENKLMRVRLLGDFRYNMLNISIKDFYRSEEFISKIFQELEDQEKYTLKEVEVFCKTFLNPNEMWPRINKDEKFKKSLELVNSKLYKILDEKEREALSRRLSGELIFKRSKKVYE